MSRLIVPLGMMVCLCVSLASDTAAQREGLIVGFGAGPGVTTGDVDTKVGVAVDLKIGAMMSDFVQLYLTSKVNFFSEDGAAIAAGIHGLGVTRQWVSGFSVNGAAAHKADPGDRIIICCYAQLDQKEMASYKPKLVYLNENNQIIRIGNQIPVQVA